MKIRNKIIFIFVIALIAFFISFCVELFFNRKVITKNNLESVEIIDFKDIQKDGKWYKTISNDAYMVVKIKDEYVNKFNFDYQFSEDFLWEIEYNDERISHQSSNLINQAIRSINTNVQNKTIKLYFHQSDIKVKNIMINNKIYINWSRQLVLFLLILGSFLLIYYRKYFFNYLEKAFLFIGLIGGILMIIVSPKNVYTSWDDQIHLENAVAFLNSEYVPFSFALRLVEQHYKIDGSTFQTQEEKIAVYKKLNKLHNETRENLLQINRYGNKYNKFVYFPYYIGIQIANIFHFEYIGTFILAKLMNFLCYILLMYFAIKISTYAKKIIFIISLFVSNIFLATQFSYDPTITASITLGLALFLRLLEMEKINKKYLLLFIGCIIWGSLPKAIYAPLLLLILFIPNQKFDSKKQAYIIKSLVCITTILLMSTFVLPFFMGSVAGDARGGNTNASEQLSLILHNPLNYCKILLKYLIVSGPNNLIGDVLFTGTAYLRGYTSSVSSLIYITNLILLLYFLFHDNYDKKVISNKIKIVFGIVYLGIFVLIATAMYLSFTPVGANGIAGIQPRYFIPMLLVLLLILAPTKNIKIKQKNSSNILLLLIPYFSLMIINFFIVYRGLGI